jgi:hypothetical protein
MVLTFESALVSRVLFLDGKIMDATCHYTPSGIVEQREATIVD